MKKILFGLLTAMFALTAAAQSASANSNLSTQIVIVTGFPVASGPDRFVRPFADELSKTLNVPVIVENRPGGNGIIGLNYYKDLPRDKHYVYWGEPAVMYNYPLMFGGKTDLVSNLEVLMPGTYANLAMIVNPDIKNLADLKKAIKKSAFFGTYAPGAPGQMYSYQVAKALKEPISTVLYKDYGQWHIDTSTGQLAFSFTTVASSLPLVNMGKTKMLAITGDRRDPQHPDVPTLDELFGYKTGITAPYTSSVFYIHKDTPQAIKDSLRSAFQKYMTTARVKETLEKVSYYHLAPETKTAADMERFNKKEQDLHYKFLKELKIDVKPF
jgi:tripartite-type tricarboxylate transporter receptor subunit TctC